HHGATTTSQSAVAAAAGRQLHRRRVIHQAMTKQMTDQTITNDLESEPIASAAPSMIVGRRQSLPCASCNSAPKARNVAVETRRSGVGSDRGVIISDIKPKTEYAPTNPAGVLSSVRPQITEASSNALRKYSKPAIEPMKSRK